MKKFFLILLPLLVGSCIYSGEKVYKDEVVSSVNVDQAEADINNVLEHWHRAAAEAKFDEYFDLMTEDGIFIGTDATENWDIKEFQNFSKPYFDRGTAWDFSTLERNIYLSEDGEIAWFDELLDTWMGICRGSGVMVRQDGDWKIKHYVLSLTVPNDVINEVIAVKKEKDSILILKFQ